MRTTAKEPAQDYSQKSDHLIDGDGNSEIMIKEIKGTPKKPKIIGELVNGKTILFNVTQL